MMYCFVYCLYYILCMYGIVYNYCYVYICMSIGGSGKYTNEHQAGLKPIGAAGKIKHHHNKQHTNKSPTHGKSAADDILVYQSTKPHPSTQQLLQDPQRFLDQLRKEQNDLLLKLLEVERRAEDECIQSLRL